MSKALQKELVAQATGKSTEPKFESLVELSKMDLARALNFYNLNYEAKHKKPWAITWAKKNRPELVSQMNAAPMYMFGTFAVLARIQQRGAILNQAHIDQMVANFESLGPVKSDEDEEQPKAKIKRPKVNSLFAEFDDMLDDAVITYSEPKFSATGDAAPIIALIDREIANIDADYEGKTYPKHMRKWFKAAKSKLETAQATAKTKRVVVRKPRKIDPLKMTKDVKFQRRDDELKISGLNAADIVGKKKVYVYNSKYRQLIKIVAAADAGFMFSGTTMQNVDLSKSVVKTIRKPAQDLKDKMGIRELDRTYNNMKTKETQLTTGRVNANMLFLQAS